MRGPRGLPISPPVRYTVPASVDETNKYYYYYYYYYYHYYYYYYY